MQTLSHQIVTAQLTAHYRSPPALPPLWVLRESDLWPEGGKCFQHLNLTFLSLSLSFFLSLFSLLLFFLGSCGVAFSASPSSAELFGAPAARCDLTGSFSLSASGLHKQNIQIHILTLTGRWFWSSWATSSERCIPWVLIVKGEQGM